MKRLNTTILETRALYYSLISCHLRSLSSNALIEKETLQKKSIRLENFEKKSHHQKIKLLDTWKTVSQKQHKLCNSGALTPSFLIRQNKGKGKSSSACSVEDAILYLLYGDLRLASLLHNSSFNTAEKKLQAIFFRGMAKSTSYYLPLSQQGILNSLHSQHKSFTFSNFLEPKQAHKRWKNMSFYQSFTDMLLVVAPTEKMLYFEVCAKYSNSTFSQQFLLSAERQYNELSVEAKALFRPITDKEKRKFERFCSLHCGGLNKENFDIVSLFAAFRGIKPLPHSVAGAQMSERKCMCEDAVRALEIHDIYKSFLSADSIHDSDFYRARRAMSKLQLLRSSDCGWYLHRHHQSHHGYTIVPAEAYTLRCDCKLDEVTVAEMLVSIRQARSVYDEVLERANFLRTKAHSEKLCIYNVKEVVEHHIKRIKDLEGRKKKDSKSPVSFAKAKKQYFGRCLHTKKKNGKTMPQHPAMPSFLHSSQSVRPTRNRVYLHSKTTKKDILKKAFPPHPNIEAKKQYSRNAKEGKISAKCFPSNHIVSRPFIKLLPKNSIKEEPKRISLLSFSSLYESLKPRTRLSLIGKKHVTESN